MRDDFSTLPTGRLTRTTVVDMIFAPGRRFQHWPVGEVSLPPVVSSPSVYTPCLPSLSFFLVVDSACWLWVVVAVDGRAQAHCLQDDVPHPSWRYLALECPPPLSDIPTLCCAFTVPPRTFNCGFMQGTSTGIPHAWPANYAPAVSGEVQHMIKCE